MLRTTSIMTYCLVKRWKPVDVNVPGRLHLIVAVDMQISQTAMTLAVVFELFSTKQEKPIVIGLHCVHTILIFSEAFNKPNLVFR